jgi:hypothetical protein
MSLIFPMWWTSFASKCNNSFEPDYAVHQQIVVLIILLCRYQCIENDLLYPLRTPHNIAPYKSKGLDRASELHISWDSAEQSSQSMKHSQEDECRNQSGTYNNESSIAYMTFPFFTDYNHMRITKIILSYLSIHSC